MGKNRWLNERKKSGKVQGWLICAGVTVFLMFILAIFFDFYYCMNDDTTMRDILCGSYTGVPEGRNIQMLYPVSFLISLFYRLLPSVPWYGLFLCGCQFLFIYLLCCRVTGFTKAIWKKAVLAVMVGSFAWSVLLYELIFVQYTMTSAMLMASAVFWFYTSESNGNAAKFLKENVLSVVLTVLAFLIRSEMALLLFPFLLAAGLCKWTKEEKIFTKENCVKYLGVIGSTVLCMAAALLINKLAYGSEEWERFDKFFDERTEIYDFLGYPMYEGNEEFYDGLGILPEEAELIDNYNFALDDNIDEKVMEKMVFYQKEKRGGNAIFLIDLKTALWIYRHSLFSSEYMPYNVLVLFAYLLLVFAAIEGRDKSYIWKIPMLVFARSVCWMYIILRNRTPERITHGLFLMETVLLFALLAGEWKKKNASRITASAIAFMIVIISFPAIWEKTNTEFMHRSKINEEWIMLQGYFKENPDNFYVVDVYSTVDYTEKMFADVDNSYRNFDLCGGWTAKSPLYRKKAAQRGIEDLERDLLEKDHVFFVSKANRGVGWLKEYYAAKGRKCEMETVEEIVVNGEVRFVIYRLL